MYAVFDAELPLLIPALLAALAGACIGIERELRNKPAGISTNMLICTGAAIFTVISRTVDADSTSRIAANILTGIGFIGAGLIFKEGLTNEIHGLTTAAGIWLAAAVGMAFGYSYYMLGLVGTIVAIVAPRLPRLRTMNGNGKNDHTLPQVR